MQLSDEEIKLTNNLEIQKIVMAFEMGDYLAKIEETKQKYK